MSNRSRRNRRAETPVQPIEPQNDGLEADFENNFQPAVNLPPSPWLFHLPGLVCLIGAGALGAAGKLMPGVVKTTEQLSLSPGLVGGIGVGFLLGGFIMTGLRRVSGRIDHVENRTAELTDQNQDIRTGLADLGSIDVAAKLSQVASGMAPSEIQASLAKTDEKLNNLTKAIRMLTQPMEETSEILPRLEGKLGDAVEETKITRESVMAKLDRLDQDLPQLTVKRFNEKLSSHLQPINELINEKQQATEEGILASQEQLEQAFGSLRMSFNEEIKQEMDLILNKINQTEELSKDLISEAKGLLTQSTEHEPGQGPEISLEEMHSVRHSIDQLMDMVRSLDFKTQATTAADTQAPEAQLQTAAASSTPAPTPSASGGGKGSVLSSIEKLKAMKGK